MELSVLEMVLRGIGVDMLASEYLPFFSLLASNRGVSCTDRLAALEYIVKISSYKRTSDQLIHIQAHGYQWCEKRNNLQ